MPPAPNDPPLPPVYRREIEQTYHLFGLRMQQEDVAALLDDAEAALRSIAGDRPLEFRDDASATPALERCFDRILQATGVVASDRELRRLLAWHQVARIIAWEVLRRVWGDVMDPFDPENALIGIPSVPSGVLWKVGSEATAERLRREVKRGQIWINATDMPASSWASVRSLVQFERRLMGKPFGRPGRPAGSADSRRQRVRLQIRSAMSNREAYELAVDEGLRSGPWSDPTDDRVHGRNRKWVSRFRREHEQAK